MNKRSMRILGFSQIRDMLVRLAPSRLSKEAARALKPDTDEDTVVKSLTDTEEAVVCLEREGQIPLGGITDIRPFLEKAKREVTLSADECIAVWENAQRYGQIQDFFAPKEAEYPQLSQRAETLGDFSLLVQRVGAVFDENHQVRDNASVELARLRTRIAELDEKSYRDKLWDHRPLTDFWRVGRGIAQRLYSYGIDTMGKIARCSIHQEELLYKLFGVNAELLIDHAWGWESCTMEMVKAYRPEHSSMSSGQVLQEAYSFRKARVVVQEMVDAIALDLVEKRCVSDQLVLYVGYDRESLTSPEGKHYTGPVSVDWYGRKVPKSAHGTANLHRFTSSSRLIAKAILALYDKIVDKRLLVRRLSIATNHVISEEQMKQRTSKPVELDMFTDYEAVKKEKQIEEAALARERKIQETIINIKNKFGKNSLLRGLNFNEGSTAKERNKQIGGHKA